MASGSECECVPPSPSWEQDKYLLLNLSKAAGSCLLKELGGTYGTEPSSWLGTVREQTPEVLTPLCKSQTPLRGYFQALQRTNFSCFSDPATPGQQRLCSGRRDVPVPRGHGDTHHLEGVSSRNKVMEEHPGCFGGCHGG